MKCKGGGGGPGRGMRTDEKKHLNKPQASTNPESVIKGGKCCAEDKMYVVFT